MANELPYKEGTIKLTWINPKDYRILESRMFNSVDEALSNLPKDIKPNNFLVFRLIKTDGTRYTWELLDMGRSKEYINGMKFKDNKVLYYGTIAITILGVIHLGRLIMGK